MPPSSTHRILQEMQHCGFVIKDEVKSATGQDLRRACWPYSSKRQTFSMRPPEERWPI
ncbi:helix-turn-helix domain-containing protein [Flavonifractor plautii]|nr:helix-turn-helix domain-containing protein [Flavonifractor plautii]